jgi:hypothetical protein
MVLNKKVSIETIRSNYKNGTIIYKKIQNLRLADIFNITGFDYCIQVFGFNKFLI